jgi:hypothetical protein
MKEAMKTFQNETDPSAEAVQSSVHSADLGDVLGVEEGGFCNLRSIVVNYLRLWLNECPGLTNFLSHQLPHEIQVDSMVAPGAAAVAKQESALDSSRLRKSQDILAESINNLAEARKWMMAGTECHCSEM